MPTLRANAKPSPEATGPSQPVITALEAGLLLVGALLSAVWATDAWLGERAHDSLAAWAVVAHAPLLLVGIGAAVLWWRAPSMALPLWRDKSSAYLTLGALFAGPGAALVAGPTASSTSLAPHLTGPQMTAWLLVWMGLAGPALHELVFRGILQHGLSSRVGKPAAVIISALASGLALSTSESFGSGLTLGVICAVLCCAGRCLLPAIVVHVVWNLTTGLFADVMNPPAAIASVCILGPVGFGAALTGYVMWQFGPERRGCGESDYVR